MLVFHGYFTDIKNRNRNNCRVQKQRKKALFTFFCVLLGHRDFNIFQPKKGYQWFWRSRVITQLFLKEHTVGQASYRGAGIWLPCHQWRVRLRLVYFFFFASSSLASSPVKTLPSLLRTILKSLNTPVPVTSSDWPRAKPTLSIAVLMDQYTTWKIPDKEYARYVWIYCSPFNQKASQGVREPAHF